MKFFFIYKSLAHPETNGFVQPFTLQERLTHAKIAEKRLGATIPWIVDAIDNRFKHALGDRPNSEFIIDPKGKIVKARSWSSPSETRKDLETLVGKVEQITKPSDVRINLKVANKSNVAKGVVPRVQRPRMRALKFEAKADKRNDKYLAKLRPEASSGLNRDGKGQLYLGFHLDPIYDAHWNNLSPALKLKIEAPEGVKVSRDEWTAPKPKVAEDGDPREVLLDVENWTGKDPIRIKTTYFACEGEKGCFRLEQEYLVYNQADRDGGSARSFGGGGRRPTARGFPTPGEVLPQAAQQRLQLTDEQKKQLEALQKEVDAKIKEILTPGQARRLQQMKERLQRLQRSGGGFPRRRP